MNPLLKKILVVSVSILIASTILGGTLYFKYRDIEPQEHLDSNLLTVKKVTEILENDSDFDGLKDWEESLWNTSRDNADTDGDGTSDGDEVRLSRNPLKAGPDDELTKDEKDVIENKIEGALGGTETEKLAKDFLVTYLLAKQNGQELTASQKNEIVTAMAQSYSNKIVSKQYILSDITISSINNEKTYRAYGNEIGAYIILNSDIVIENELETFKQYLENEDGSVLSKMDPLISSYDKVLTSSLKMSVPSDLAYIHLAFLNSLSTYVSSLKALRNGDKDPLEAAWAISDHTTYAQNLQTALFDMANFFSNNGVIFQQVESGSVLNAGV